MSGDEFEVKFIYRVFNKTTEGGQLESIKDKVLARYHDCVFAEGTNTYWPVDPSDVDSLRERGILLTEIDGKLHLATQEVVGTLFRHTYEEASAIVTDIQHHFPGEFASMQVVSIWRTEVFAR
jgi:hypothetical protein